MTKFWVFDPVKQDAHGPYEIAELKAVPGISIETVVAPEGADDRSAWRPVKAHEALRGLFAKAPPLPLPKTTSGRTSPLANAPRAIPIRETDAKKMRFWIGIGGAALAAVLLLLPYIPTSSESAARRAAEEIVMKMEPSSKQIVESQVLKDVGQGIYMMCVMIDSQAPPAGTIRSTYVVTLKVEASGEIKQAMSPSKVSDSRTGGLQFSCAALKDSGKF